MEFTFKNLEQENVYIEVLYTAENTNWISLDKIIWVKMDDVSSMEANLKRMIEQ